MLVAYAWLSSVMTLTVDAYANLKLHLHHIHQLLLKYWCTWCGLLKPHWPADPVVTIPHGRLKIIRNAETLRYPSQHLSSSSATAKTEKPPLGVNLDIDISRMGLFVKAGQWLRILLHLDAEGCSVFWCKPKTAGADFLDSDSPYVSQTGHVETVEHYQLSVLFSPQDQAISMKVPISMLLHTWQEWKFATFLRR
jgi:hypothetical protein